MPSTKICKFAQENFEAGTADVFRPNRSRALPVPRVLMNWSDENFRHSVEILNEKVKKKKKESSQKRTRKFGGKLKKKQNGKNIELKVSRTPKK